MGHSELPSHSLARKYALPPLYCEVSPVPIMASCGEQAVAASHMSSAGYRASLKRAPHGYGIVPTSSDVRGWDGDGCVLGAARVDARYGRRGARRGVGVAFMARKADTSIRLRLMCAACADAAYDSPW